MFDVLYSDPLDQARHRAGPLAMEREQYLQYRAAQGATYGTLKVMACMLLWIARKINPPQGSSVTMGQIQRAASWWVSRRRRVPLNKPHQVRQNFVGQATAWLRYMGRLQPTKAKQLRHERLLDDCARLDEARLRAVSADHQGEFVFVPALLDLVRSKKEALFQGECQGR